MTKVICAMFLVGMLAAPLRAQDGSSTKLTAFDYVQMCQHPEQTDTFAYCTGFIDGLRFGSDAVRLVTAAGYNEFFCAPAGTTLTQFRQAFLTEIQKHPESLKDYGPSAVFLSLTRRYPCKPEGNPLNTKAVSAPSPGSDSKITAFVNADGKTVFTPAPKAIPAPAPPRPQQDYFTIGSTKDDVLRIQGQPTTVSDRFWWYGVSSYVTFGNGRVDGWNGSNLKAKMLPSGPSK